MRAAAAVADRELAQARRALTDEGPATALASVIKSAERAVIDARRKDVPRSQVIDLERAVADLKREIDRRIVDEIRRDRQRAQAATRAGKVALAAVLQRRAAISVGPHKGMWSKYQASLGTRTGLLQTNFFLGTIGEKDDKKKVHIAIDEDGNLQFVRDIDGSILFDRTRGDIEPEVWDFS